MIDLHLDVSGNRYTDSRDFLMCFHTEGFCSDWTHGSRWDRSCDFLVTGRSSLLPSSMLPSQRVREVNGEGGGELVNEMKHVRVIIYCFMAERRHRLFVITPFHFLSFFCWLAVFNGPFHNGPSEEPGWV